MTHAVIIVGAGDHARLLAGMLKASGKAVAGFVDSDSSRWGVMIDGVPVIGGDDVLENAPSTVLVNGVGSTASTAKRRELFGRLVARGFRFTGAIHPSAIVADDVSLARDVQLMAGAIIQRGASIGINTIVNTGAIVDHDSWIGDHCHIAPGCTLSGRVVIGEGCHIGAGATVIQGIKIGANVLIGAGAVVIRDVAAGKLVVGVPAREMMS